MHRFSRMGEGIVLGVVICVLLLATACTLKVRAPSTVTIDPVHSADIAATAETQADNDLAEMNEPQTYNDIAATAEPRTDNGAAATNEPQIDDDTAATVEPQDDNGAVATAEPQTDNDITTAAEERIDINTASAEELETLDGIGEVLAQRIVEWREANGKFESVDDLCLVSGIGESKLEAVRDRICVS